MNPEPRLSNSSLNHLRAALLGQLHCPQKAAQTRWVLFVGIQTLTEVPLGPGCSLFGGAVQLGGLGAEASPTSRWVPHGSRGPAKGAVWGCQVESAGSGSVDGGNEGQI